MSIFVVGDLHGEMETRKLSHKSWPEGKTLTREDYVIVAGDFGLVFSPIQSAAERYWIKWLDKMPWTTLVIDGNHENFNRLYALPVVDKFGGRVRQISQNIFWLQRGEIYNIAGKKFFVMGGATSTDKQWRTEDISWWKAEIPTWSEMDHGIQNLIIHQYHVDFVVSHTAPATIVKIYLQSLGLGSYEQCPVSNYLDNIASNLSFHQWFFGHFHNDWDFGKYSMCYGKIRKVE